MIAELLAHLAAKAGHAAVSGEVPAEPLHYLMRSAELAELRAMLLGDNADSVAITGQGHALGVQGMGGVGKTVLAAALTRDAAVQKAYPDGIFWLTVSAQPNLLNLLNQLARWLPDCDSPLTNETEPQKKVREALAGKRALLILDDVWHVDHAAALNVMSAPGRLLVTTRKREVLVSLDAEEVCVDVLTPEAALRLLADWAREPDPARLPDEVADIARECGYLPLALAMIGAMIRLRPTAWADVLELLRGRDLEEFRRAFPDYPYPNLLRAIAVGVDDLPAQDRERYLDLAVFPEDQAIPEGSLQVFWDLTPAKTRTCMDRLVARSLATWQEKADQGALLLHDLQRDYVRKVREKRLLELHTRLLDNYRARCPNGWSSGPDDSYFFQHLADHMYKANWGDELHALAHDGAFLERQEAVADPSQVFQTLLLDINLCLKDERTVHAAETGRVYHSRHGVSEARLERFRKAILRGEDRMARSIAQSARTHDVRCCLMAEGLRAALVKNQFVSANEWLDAIERMPHKEVGSDLSSLLAPAIAAIADYDIDRLGPLWTRSDDVTLLQLVRRACALGELAKAGRIGRTFFKRHPYYMAKKIVHLIVKEPGGRAAHDDVREILRYLWSSVSSTEWQGLIPYYAKRAFEAGDKEWAYWFHRTPPVATANKMWHLAPVEAETDTQAYARFSEGAWLSDVRTPPSATDPPNGFAPKSLQPITGRMRGDYWGESIEIDTLSEACCEAESIKEEHRLQALAWVSGHARLAGHEDWGWKLVAKVMTAFDAAGRCAWRGLLRAAMAEAMARFGRTAEAVTMFRQAIDEASAAFKDVAERFVRSVKSGLVRADASTLTAIISGSDLRESEDRHDDHLPAVVAREARSLLGQVQRANEQPDNDRDSCRDVDLCRDSPESENREATWFQATLALSTGWEELLDEARACVSQFDEKAACTHVNRAREEVKRIAKQDLPKPKGLHAALAWVFETVEGLGPKRRFWEHAYTIKACGDLAKTVDEASRYELRQLVASVVPAAIGAIMQLSGLRVPEGGAKPQDLESVLRHAAASQPKDFQIHCAVTVEMIVGLESSGAGNIAAVMRRQMLAVAPLLSELPGDSFVPGFAWGSILKPLALSLAAAGDLQAAEQAVEAMITLAAQDREWIEYEADFKDLFSTLYHSPHIPLPNHAWQRLVERILKAVAHRNGRYKRDDALRDAVTMACDMRNRALVNEWLDRLLYEGGDIGRFEGEKLALAGYDRELLAALRATSSPERRLEVIRKVIRRPVMQSVELWRYLVVEVLPFEDLFEQLMAHAVDREWRQLLGGDDEPALLRLTEMPRGG
ncbi:MAG: NB-ARC domain-containing protein [Planctomycetota bacterium]|jgi:hypothetical protein